MSDGTPQGPDRPDRPEDPQEPATDSTGAYRQAPPPQGERYGGYQSMPDPAAGPPGPAPQVGVPASISNAVKLMYAGAVISLINALSVLFTRDTMRTSVADALRKQGKSVDASTVDSAVNVGIILGLVIGLIGVALWIWMARTNQSGRSWARVVATVLGALNILFTLLSLGQDTSTGLSRILGIISAILAVVILVLLWRKESSAFYAAHSAPRY